MNLPHPNKVERYRLEKGDSKAELARQAKICVGVIYKMEKEPHKKTRPESKMKVANALGFPPLRVFPNDPQLKIEFDDEYESS